ncbi:siphovirus Gp157 family protein [Staphylococcus arlettae]|uniref:siphovirus Gp157 family protein n=1 Tax=Staphylococcus arlettae TaxID=29378 RepID=UPI0021D104AD|nr:siphovirus Gp157 family protein [Staphylococcus arlettae]UXU51842.1 siphovirus Gp157 family protein [Staphylococcus arlettae]
MTTLFNLTDNYKQVYDLIAEQGDEQALNDTLASINDALEDKADGYVAVIKTLEGDNKAIDDEIERLQQRKTTNKNGVDRLKESLKEAMETTGKTKFKTALNSYTIASNAPSKDITDLKLIPDEYWVSQAPKINSKLLLDDLKAGKEIPGAELKRTQSLRVR